MGFFLLFFLGGGGVTTTQQWWRADNALVCSPRKEPFFEHLQQPQKSNTIKDEMPSGGDSFLKLFSVVQFEQKGHEGINQGSSAYSLPSQLRIGIHARY